MITIKRDASVKMCSQFKVKVQEQKRSRKFSRTLSLCISLSLSLSHRAHLTHNIGSASALPIILFLYTCIPRYVGQRALVVVVQNGRQSWRSFRNVLRSASFFILIFAFAICTGPGTYCHPHSLLLSQFRSRIR